MKSYREIANRFELLKEAIEDNDTDQYYSEDEMILMTELCTMCNLDWRSIEIDNNVKERSLAGWKMFNILIRFSVHVYNETNGVMDLF